jgi:SAM-dependent methyltransferase
MAIAPDGSPVPLYLALPGDDEAAVVASVAHAGATVLELGCGAGRVTRPLVALGFRVTGVDNSADMLAHVTGVTGVTTVLADLETLRLEQRFDVVVLASHFVNVVLDAERLAFLRTCAYHVRDDGAVLVERYPPGWVRTAQPSRRELFGVVLDFHDAKHEGDVLHATMTYEVDGATFDQTFTAVDVDDDRLARDAEQSGLVIDRVLDDARTWVVLRRPRA